MIEVLAVVGIIGDAFIGALVGKLTDEILKKLQQDPAKRTIKLALGAAIQRYATSGLRLDLAQPLLQKGGPLTDSVVIQELTHLVRFEREPNAELIGQHWKAFVEVPPPWCDFTSEATRLLEYFRAELRGTELFRPVFDAKSLDSIAAHVATSTLSLTHMEEQLVDLEALLSDRFIELCHAFTEASSTIRDHIRDYSRFIKEKTHDFVGRQFVFDAVTRFTETHSSGYFFIRGDPGIGKSALAAQLVKTNGYIHHFNIRGEGINKAEMFLRNICAQLIVVYQLNHFSLPPGAMQDAGFLNQLLTETSDKLRPDEKTIIVIDALDEVDTLSLAPGVNVLYLPLSLPRGIFLVATTRKGAVELRIECEQDALDLEHDSAGNIADIRTYIEQIVGWPGIQAYIAAQGIDNELFIEHLVEKSEGNFMYLRYVVPEIEHGAYKDLGLDALPLGLQSYYKDHWRRMRGKDEESWFEYKLPIIMALTVVKEPVSIDLIADFSGVEKRSRIVATLQEWEQFLHEDQVEYQGEQQKRYSVYHASFHDFISRMEEVKEEQVSRKLAHKQIADSLWSELFDHE